MISETEMQKILYKLVEKTNQKMLFWVEGESSAFSVSFTQSTILLECIPSIDPFDVVMGKHIFVLTALNSRGESVGRLAANPNEIMNEPMANLYDIVQSQFKRVDDTLNDILFGLGD